MEMTKIPGWDKPLSRMVMGAINFTLDTYETSSALMDTAVRYGINTFDTAHIYCGGDSERALGKWMDERNNREDIFIISKCAHPNKDRARVTPCDISSDLLDSLTRLRTDYIDLYLLHRDDLDVPVGPIMDIFHEHCKAGHIKAFGGSNWTHQRVAEANAYAASKGQTQMVAVSPNYSLCDQLDDPWGAGCVTVGGEENAEAREFYRKNSMPLFAYSSLGRGVLSGRVTRENYREILDGAAIKAYAHEVNFARLDRARELADKKDVSVPQIALAYLLCQPLNVFPLVMAGNDKEMSETAAAIDIKLTENECKWLENG